MGMFDTFTSWDEKLSIQLKVGPCLLDDYKEGDAIDNVVEGVYYAPDGVVVIQNGVVVSVTATLDKAPPGLPCFTKWGDQFDPTTENVEQFHPLKGLFEKKEG